MEFIKFAHLRGLLLSLIFLGSHLCQLSIRLFHPLDNCAVVDFRDSLNGSEAHTIEVHLQTQPSYIIAVTPVGLRIGDKLMGTLTAAMILFPAPEAVF